MNRMGRIARTAFAGLGCALGLLVAGGLARGAGAGGAPAAPPKPSAPPAGGAGAGTLRVAVLDALAILPKYKAHMQLVKDAEEQVAKTEKAQAEEEKALKETAARLENPGAEAPDPAKRAQDIREFQAKVSDFQERRQAEWERLRAYFVTNVTVLQYEVVVAVEKVAEGRFDLVFSKRVSNWPPPPLYLGPATDITEEVLSRLNEGYETRPFKKEAEKRVAALQELLKLQRGVTPEGATPANPRAPAATPPAPPPVPPAPPAAPAATRRP